MINVAIVEDHPMFRQGLTQTIRQAPGLELVLATGSVEDFDARTVVQPDVVILDLGLPGGGLEGAAAVEHLCSQGFKVLVVSIEDGEVPVVDAISAGAAGYLTKHAEQDEVIRAVNAIASGGTYVSATLAAYLLKEPIRLTAREKEILRLVASGEQDQDIAEQLHISARTVHGHLEQIRGKASRHRVKTGRHNRVELVWLAIEHGLAPRRRRRG